METQNDNAAVLQTILATYDALFSNLGSEARASFKNTIDTYMSSDINIPEMDIVSSQVAYTNWNFGLVNGLKAKIAGSKLTDTDEDQAAQIASFVAQDLRIVGKIAQFAESKYEVDSNNSQYQYKIAEVKQLYNADIDSINIEISSLNARLATVKSGDIGLYVYDADPVQTLSKEIATQQELLAEAQSLKTQLDSFEAGTLGSKGSGAEEFTKAYADFAQLRLDALALKKVDLLVQLEKHSNVQSGDAVSPYIDGINNDIAANSRNILNLSENRDTQAEFANKTADLKASVLSGAGNVLYAIQAGVGFATKGEDAPASSYVASAGFLGEAVLGGVGDVLEATSHAKAANVLKGGASLALVAGNAASFAPIAKMLATGKGADGKEISAEHLSVIKAEVGLQGTSLALASIEGALSIAQLAVTAGSKAASVLGTAVPIIGAIGAVVGAINPLKWAEFGQKQERIDAIRKSDTYSSDLLGGLLTESKTIEAAFYGTTTALNVVTGVASGVIAATGVGAPIAAAVGLIGGAISAIVGAFEQVALEDLANKYATKIRTDENGNAQSVEDFFQGSFEQKQEKTKDHYKDFFTEIVADDDIDQVVALGGQGLDVTDIELSAITKTSGELNKTAQNFVETFTENGWQERTQELSQKTGSDIDLIQLQNANGAKTYLTFTTPLFAAGNESTSRESTGKNAYQTTLKITDLSGWRIRDFGDNETTFNLSKVITSAEGVRGEKQDIRFEIEAGGGNDTLFSYEAGVTFDGGSGTDTASYTRLSDTNLSSGLNVSLQSSGAGQPETITVHKNLSSGSKTYQESIESKSINYGKRTEVVEYRAVSLVESTADGQSTDLLSGIEIFHGSSLSDSIDLAASNQIKQVFGFGGNDVIKVGGSIEVVSGGSGNDQIALSDDVAAKAFSGERLLYIDGGDGQYDAVSISSTSFASLLSEHESQLLREKLAQDVANSLLSAETANRNEELAATSQSLTNILKKNDANALKKVALFNTEYVKVELADTGVSTQNTAHSLTDYRQAINGVFSNVDTTTKAVSEVNIFASAANSQTSVSLIGGDHNDMLEGSRYNDYLFGGSGTDVFRESNGNDILVGALGKDVYTYDNARSGAAGDYSGHDIITGPRPEDIKGDILNISAGLSAKAFLFRYSDDLVVGLGENRTVTIANFYGSGDNGLNASLKRTNESLDALSNLQISTNEFVINVEGSAANASQVKFHSSNDAYRSSVQSSYSTFRAGDNWSALNDASSPSSDFANQLSLTLEAERGGAKIGVSELSQLTGLSQAVSSINVRAGGSGVDTITGTSGNDVIHGGSGLDNLDGGAGFDVASYTGASYAIKFDLRGDQKEYYQFNGNYYVGDQVANFEGVIGTSFNDVIIGNEANNYLVGGNGADTITGGGGNDLIHGGNGLDNLDGGAGFDIASYEGASYAIKFDLNGSQTEFYKFNGNYYVGDQVANFEGVIGTSLNDILIGNAFDNYLAGGNGIDTITGGAGNDTIHGGNGLDTLDGGAGFDIASYEGASYAIKFDLRGDQSEFYLFNGNFLAGDSVANFEGVIGSSLNDTFIGNAENNYFVGGAGNDVFTGGAGADQFVFKAGSGHDVIEDYLAGTDKLTIDPALKDSLSFNQAGQDVRIDIGADSSITLRGVSLNKFLIEDQLFA